MSQTVWTSHLKSSDGTTTAAPKKAKHNNAANSSTNSKTTPPSETRPRTNRTKLLSPHAFRIVLDEHVDQLSECPSITAETAEEILEEYNYPGELLAELQAQSVSNGGGYSVELPVDPETVHREMSETGMDYYTGKEAFLREDRGLPPKVRRVVETDGSEEVYELLGVSEPGYTAHYTLEKPSKMEVERRVWHRTGKLGRQKQTELFEQFPWVQLENYVEDQEWQYIEEPDYQRLEEKYQTERKRSGPDLEVGETEQTGFEDF